MTFTVRLFTVVAAALPIAAQTTSGNITGRLHDPSAAAIPAAEVTAKNADTGLELRAESNSEGLYTFSLLPPGSYQVTARAKGFRAVTRPAQLLTGQTLRVDFTLELGSVAEAVEISAVVNQIQTENSKIVSAVNNKMVDELPLVVGGAMRSPFDLSLITPEANRAEGVGDADTSLSVGGGQDDARWRHRADDIFEPHRGFGPEYPVGGRHHRVCRRVERIQG